MIYGFYVCVLRNFKSSLQVCQRYASNIFWSREQFLLLLSWYRQSWASILLLLLVAGVTLVSFLTGLAVVLPHLSEEQEPSKDHLMQYRYPKWCCYGTRERFGQYQNKVPPYAVIDNHHGRIETHPQPGAKWNPEDWSFNYWFSASRVMVWSRPRRRQNHEYDICAPPTLFEKAWRNTTKLRFSTNLLLVSFDCIVFSYTS